MIPVAKSTIDPSKNASHARRTPSATQREPSRPLTKQQHTPQIPFTTSARLPPPAQTRQSHLTGAVSRPSAGRSYPKGVFLATSSTIPGFRWIKIGIETEFYLAEMEGEPNEDSFINFAMTFAEKYNQKVSLQYPRMRETIRPESYTGPYNEWCLVPESSLGSNCSPCKSMHQN